MQGMKIEYLRLKNFKALRDVEMREIPNFCVFVGANGVGKSTFFSVFEFLQKAFETNVTTALCIYYQNGDPLGYLWKRGDSENYAD